MKKLTVEDIFDPRELPHLSLASAKLREAGVSPGRTLRSMELLKGHRWVRPGSVPWLPSSDWHDTDVVSLDGDEVRLVAIAAKRPGTGAFRKLIWAIEAAGLSPVVICPIGRIMPAILKKWGWVETKVGTTFEDREEQWRPPRQTEAQGEATGAGQSTIPDEAIARAGGPSGGQGSME